MNLDILKSHPYISPDIKIEKFTDPYPHIVIDNLFKPEIYQKMCDKFQTYISRVEKPYGQVGDSGNTYDALIYGMREEDCIEGYDFFKLKLWQNFISNIFDFLQARLSKVYFTLLHHYIYIVSFQFFLILLKHS